MKVKVISRNEEQFTKERPQDLRKVQRNTKPTLHPLEKAREYTRALNAIKLDKHFSKPFVGALSGHTDSVYCMAKNPTSLVDILSGGCDGEIRRWNLSDRETLWRSPKAHTGFVRGLSYSRDGQRFLSCSDDKTVKLWEVKSKKDQAKATFLGKHAFTGLDHHWTSARFATSSTAVDVWDETRSAPLQTFNWGADGTTFVKFNPVEVDTFLTCGTDRGLILYDLRSGAQLKKMTMQTRCNAAAWNPTEAFHFTAASEDHHLYTFDMRKLQSALTVHQDHVSAVMHVDYDPTGTRLVSGSYDKTIRIYQDRAGHSHLCYHTKRMQRVFCVLFTMDSKYVLSGSDDTNVRLWKSKPNEKMGTALPREKAKTAYNEALTQQYKHMPEIRRIARHQHVPKAIKKAKAAKEEFKKKTQAKAKNVRDHSKPGSVPKLKEREKKIWKVHD